MWLCSFCSSETDHLCTTESESGCHKDAAEALETVLEGARIVPVFRANVASIIGRDATNVYHNGEDDETTARHDLDERKHELNLTVTANSKELDDNEEDQEYCHPNCYWYIVPPELDGDGGSGEFEREDNEPAKSILPTDSKAQRLVDEPACVREEGTVDGVKNCQFTKRLHGTQKHKPSDHETEDKTAGSTGSER